MTQNFLLIISLIFLASCQIFAKKEIANSGSASSRIQASQESSKSLFDELDE
jgi:hypothetical protein